ncbi:hypothetical protein UG55_100372 [Frankia sp. EI5c]|nr:hypothetical protein UG55_100372 [Frankia sp. EI5c]
MVAVAIVACEVVFWVLLLAGVATRYGLGWRRRSAVLLACVPLVDVVLLTVTVADLRWGARTADWTHGLSAVYLGFSVVFGPPLVAGVDRWFARRRPPHPAVLSTSIAPAGPEAADSPASAAGGAGGVALAEAPTEAEAPDARLARHWREWRRCLTACLLAAATLGLIILAGGDPERTRALWAGGGLFTQLGVLCAGWLLVGPVWTATGTWVRGVFPTGPTTSGTDTSREVSGR